MFGGERFQDIIGTVSLGQELKTAMQKEEPEEGAEANGDNSSGTTVSKDKAKKELTPEQKAAKAEEEAERARIKEERIQKLVSV